MRKASEAMETPILDRSQITLSDRGDPQLLAWPIQGDAGGFISFDKVADWRAFVESLAIDARVPEIVRANYARAQPPYLLGWVDFSILKAGELAALIALELGLMDRYGGQITKSKRNVAALLRFMVKSDALNDDRIPMIVRCGGTAVGQLIGATHPTLAERRNTLAHGDPFDGLSTGGLLDLVRGLGNYAYRQYLAEAASLSPAPHPATFNNLEADHGEL